jgi:dipeptidyl aminopeptidase/acylaminoacyl peptidase
VSTLEENSAYTRSYITYKSGALSISGIMNMPKGTPPEGGFPVLFLNHGFIDPAIYTNGRGLKREQDYLVRRGYVVVHSDYRNHAESDKDPDADVELRFGYVEDVINGVYAIKAANLPNVNKEKIGMLGHSMGGGVTMAVLVIEPDLVQAATLFAPVSADQRENFERWTMRRPETATKIQTLFGSPNENPKFWDSVSPITYLSDIAVPVQLHHGTADDSVPVEWSDRLDRELRKEGKTIEYYRYPGEPHEFTRAWPTVMERTATFFDRAFSDEN